MSVVSDGTFGVVLEKIRTESQSTAELGARFEKIIKDFLQTDSHYRNRFSKVYLWMEWPKRDGPDTGIDLIAIQHNEELCAIQCKCYGDDGNLEMKEMGKFIAKAAGLKIKHRILVYTGNTITPNAKRVLKQNDCQIITQDHLRESSIDWSRFPKLSTKEPKALRSHQVRAVKDVLDGFKKHNRGKMIMACGTGKTLASLHIAEKQAGRGKMILYLVPSISLILQSMREWSENSNIRHYYLAVCSDASTGEGGSIMELESPVSTDSKKLVPYIQSRPKDAMTVIFSTYHSLNVVRKAVNKMQFDLILCDEAHRTTGVEDKSFFTSVHKDSYIRGKKRLYMTATPRVYSDVIKARLKEIYSMDKEETYGPEFHNLNFADAVSMGILSDFKVKIAIAPADKIDKDWQKMTIAKDGSMPLDERTLLAAVWHGITHPDDEEEEKMLQRVIAFTNRIDRSKMFAENINDKNNINRGFEGIVKQFEEKHPTGKGVEVDHIDGKTKALNRRKKLQWLDASNDDPRKCRILSNAKCLSEGVDVPALDGIVFLNPRKSKVDVVQSVGRVMRKSPGKDFGYVILPVALPSGVEYHEELDSNKTFKVVWQVLNALRSHDENFANEINRLILDKNTETTSITPRISVSVLGEDITEEVSTKFFDKIKSKLVAKVGDINYFDRYGEKLGEASHTIEARIKNKRDSSDSIKKEIGLFHDSLKKMINDSITLDSTIQVIAQHIVLSRVFDALFQGEFTSYNPISIEFDKIAKKLGLKEELEDLEGFYEDVKTELKDIKTREARQNFIKKIYGNFFESANKKETEKHGVVFTPVEPIDFIINSVQHLLKKHFKTEFNDRAVKVLEPFAGTGTFITRLLESGLITDNLYEKYKNDLFANELILLAYYIATVNIETTYSSLRQGGRYVPFDGISYTDTLRINPQYRDDESHRQNLVPFDGSFKIAHERIRHQRGTHVHVLIGNPPYSAGQNDYNDRNQNTSYPELDKRIKNTYAEKTKSHAKNALFDSYIRSLRWASDRIGNSGIIAFVTNASFIRSETAAGIRACLAEEFNEVWCFDLRGNQRTQGEVSKKEGGKIFGSGSRAPVAITILVKNPKKNDCTIHYKDIGNYHNREKKLEIIKNTKSVQGTRDWQVITPDKHHDWLDQRSDEFSKYTSMGNKDVKARKGGIVVFRMYSRGIGTSRDVWVYNSSKDEIHKNMKKHIDYCNLQNLDKPKIDSKQCKWTGDLSDRLKKSPSKFDKNKIRITLYRPFFKQYLYFDTTFNHDVSKIPKFFPERYSKNLIILTSYKSASEFSTFVTDITPDIQVMFNGQYFPLHTYGNGRDRKDNVTDSILWEYQNHYNDSKIAKKDIFYYTYGILHHPAYKKKFANNLSRELPRIPMAPDFSEFRNSGKKLVDLHLNYENCKKYNLEPLKKFGKLEKISFLKAKKNSKEPPDKTKLKINGVIAFENIPKISYAVNGRTPLEWMIDRYKFTTDEDSGITNDPTVGMTEQKTIDMIQRLIYVGTESDAIISKLSKLPFEPKNWIPPKTGMDAFSHVSNLESKI